MASFCQKLTIFQMFTEKISAKDFLQIFYLPSILVVNISTLVDICLMVMGNRTTKLWKKYWPLRF